MESYGVRAIGGAFGCTVVLILSFCAYRIKTVIFEEAVGKRLWGYPHIRKEMEEKVFLYVRAVDVRNTKQSSERCEDDSLKATSSAAIPRDERQDGE